MIETEKDGRRLVERAILVGICDYDIAEAVVREHLAELAELVGNLGIPIIGEELIRVKESNPRYLIGSGRAEELRQRIEDEKADCLVFDCELTPSQQRNWEKLTRICVVERQEIILDIFAARASTREAVLQVELARMQYSLPRLTRAWTHLSRQHGGAKGTRGEGEKQIEVDRRLVKQRISSLQAELKTVRRQRATQRKRRDRNDVPHVAIVGYTNAGKSSLLNCLAGADVLVEDKLFATLDPVTRRIILPNNQPL
ncbi:MAG: GTPase HflX, partial [Victivallales bacterium]|nr:GTPase HflX [Victivallales bacterium]